MALEQYFHVWIGFKTNKNIFTGKANKEIIGDHL